MTFSALFSLLLEFASAAAQPFADNVISMKDGDTIEVFREGAAVRIRLTGADAPESSRPYGQRAKQFTRDLVFGRTVRVAVKDTGRYGRLVVEVYEPHGEILNRELVKGGYAWWYGQYVPSDTEMGQREEKAGELGWGSGLTEVKHDVDADKEGKEGLEKRLVEQGCIPPSR